MPFSTHGMPLVHLGRHPFAVVFPKPMRVKILFGKDRPCQNGGVPWCRFLLERIGRQFDTSAFGVVLSDDFASRMEGEDSSPMMQVFHGLVVTARAWHGVLNGLLQWGVRR